jgi:hypothetical protein
MKRLLILFLTINLSCCTNKSKSDLYRDLKLPEDRIYTEIICAILEQDSSLTSSNSNTQSPVQSELRKNKIKFHYHDTTGCSEILFPDHITSIFELIYYGISNHSDLKKDSLYFAFQNEQSTSYYLMHTCANYNKFPEKELVKKLRSEKVFGYYEFTLPILNSEQNKAFVTFNTRCNGLCGHGSAYILEKTNNKWKLKRIIETWQG